ncbi:unnamed protein product, partial [marine sediment metagenome]
LMQRGYRVVSKYQDVKSTEDILSFLKQLGSTSSIAEKGLVKVVKAFSDLTGEVEKSKTAIKENVKTLTEHKEKVVEIFEKTEQTIEQVHLESQAWQKAAQEQQETWKSFREELTKERELRSLAEQRAVKAEQERDGIKLKFKALVDYFRKMIPRRGV